MMETNKTYGFTIAVKELKETVPNIFRYASAYKRVNNITSQGLWEMFVEPQPDAPKPLPEDDPNFKHPLPEEILRGDPSHASLPTIDPEAMEGEKYNMCHFWSNFEIARLSWFRSQEYEDFFQMMDRSGGFWMERVSYPSKRLMSARLLILQTVGRCPYPLTCRGSTSRTSRHPLLP
jgi:mannosyltransferase